MFAAKRIGFHTTASGWEYELQFDPDDELAQAVMHSKGVGEGLLYLAFRAESKAEALKRLVEELDSGSH